MAAVDPHRRQSAAPDRRQSAAPNRRSAASDHRSADARDRPSSAAPASRSAAAPAMPEDTDREGFKPAQGLAKGRHGGKTPQRAQTTDSIE